MRIVFLGNNLAAWRILEWLRAQGEQIAGVWVHAQERAQFREDLLAAAGEEAEMLEGPPDGNTASRIRALRPDIGLSVFFGHILPPEIIGAFPLGCINVHPSLLPWNRGANPNIWSIVERTPAGVTLHYIDSGVDSGPIIAQREIPQEPFDTGESLYHKLESACVSLFCELWPAIRAGSVSTCENPVARGTFHRRADLAKIDEVDLDRTYRARDLIDILRARSFAPYRGAYFRTNGRRIFMELKLTPAEE